MKILLLFLIHVEILLQHLNIFCITQITFINHHPLFHHVRGGGIEIIDTLSAICR